MNATPEMTNVFRFMELRPPFSPEAKSLRQNYIYDDFVGVRHSKPDRIDTDLQSAASPSAIGRLVYEQVFCGDDTLSVEEGNVQVVYKVLELLTPYRPRCPESTGPAVHQTPAESLSIVELERHPYIMEGGFYRGLKATYFLLPERLEQIEGLALFPELLRALEVMERARGDLHLSELVSELEAVFGVRPLRRVVFEKGIYAEAFQSAKRILFDTLYLLYILRRRTSVNLEHIIEGLRVLHVLEALSIDTLVATIEAGPLSQSDDQLLRKTLDVLFPDLRNWKGSGTLPTLPLIQSEADFVAFLSAMPVVHPIFARLHAYKRPFNDLKPIGIGDLKVVKQWLLAYLPGEISHIENILKGEAKKRTHRRLEKTEESFSFFSSSKEWSQKDMQSTERLELKQEVDKVIKTELSLGANASLTYTYGGGMIVANVGANFGYKRDETEQSKTAATLARDTIAKAVEQVEKNASETRTLTKLYETEETNKHDFDNKEGEGHVAGIYRWLDKKYKAQLYNFGKRLMFEFIIPDPAAFWVESRLRHFEATVDCPQPPQWPEDYPKKVTLDFKPSDIDETKFDELRQAYDLKEFAYPEATRWIEFINPATGDNYFSEKDIGGSKWFAKSYNCKIGAKGYNLKTLFIVGHLQFFGSGESEPWAQNTLEISVNGVRMKYGQSSRLVNETANEAWMLEAGWTPPATLLLGDDVLLTVGSQDLNHQYLTVRGELSLSPQARLDWQIQVYNKVKAIEQQRVDKQNQEIELAYNSRMSNYRNRLSELKATSVNALLQGQSEAFNRDLIRTELKKHCLTLLTKEFDADSEDDLIAQSDPVVDLEDDFTYRTFRVKEEATDDSPTNTTCSFEVKTKTIPYPSIDLETAKWKGRYIQFLEQAFEWQQLAYIFYPYFWAQRPDWIEMMNRADDADPNLTAFLQAGSAKVLLAVTPAYSEAVLHFLATREPWEGGPSPVIGDPLFVPLYEELHKQQDDLYNAVPEGDPWMFTLPTSLVWLDDGNPLPTFPDVP